MVKRKTLPFKNSESVAKNEKYIRKKYYGEKKQNAILLLTIFMVSETDFAEKGLNQMSTLNC